MAGRGGGGRYFGVEEAVAVLANKYFPTPVFTKPPCPKRRVIGLILLALCMGHVYLSLCPKERSLDFRTRVVIHHSPEDNGEDISVDIVAVHGLASNPDSTWAHKESGVMWLKDLLPKSFPRARIMSFNHHSAWEIDAPVQALEDYGQQLLDALNDYRKTPEEMGRQIIFIGHSFGGIIIKQALVIASAKGIRDDQYRSIANSTLGAVFLGVPHDGSPFPFWGKLKLWLHIGCMCGSSTELLDVLKPGSKVLRGLNDLFLQAYSSSHLINFYETRRVKALGLSFGLVADKYTSTFPGYVSFPLDSDHGGMNKFASEEDDNYRSVLGKIKKMVKWVQEEQLKIINREKEECLKTLTFPGLRDRGQAVGKATEFQWLHNNKVLQEWIDNKSSVVWISGKPGCGKSTFARYLVDDFPGMQNQQDGVVISFFFNNREGGYKKSQQGFLQMVMHQMLEKTPSLSSRILPKCREMKEGEEWDPKILREILTAIIKDPNIKPTRLIIDAFDEYETPDISPEDMFLEWIVGLTKYQPHFQVLITSRPDNRLSRLLGNHARILLDDVNEKDIQSYVNRNFQCLIENRDYNSEVEREAIGAIKSELIDKAQGVFLWVTLVIAELIEQMEAGGTVQMLINTLHALPGDLRGLYEMMFEKMDTRAGRDSKAWGILVWVLYAEKPLKLEEFPYVIAIGSSEQNFDSLASVHNSLDFIRTPDQMKKILHSVCNGFLEVKLQEDASGNHHVVRLIHQSAKDFLLGVPLPDPVLNSAVAPQAWIIGPEAHFHLARVCIAFLTFSDFHLTARLPNNLPFFEYATLNWIKHAPLAEEPGAGRGLAQMKKFDWPNPQKFNTWLRTFRYLSAQTPSGSPEIWETPLFVAAEIGLLGDVEYFLNLLAQGPVRPETLAKALIQAAGNGNKDITLRLIDECSTVNFDGNRGGSALERAALNGHEEIVQLFIEKRTSLNLQTEHFLQAFEVAKNADQFKVLRKLISGDFEKVFHQNSLDITARSGNAVIMQLFLNLDKVCDADAYERSLTGAVEVGNWETAYSLLKSNKVFSEKTCEKTLIAAASGAPKKFMRLLLGPKMCFSNRALDDSLIAAVGGGQKGTARLLLRSDRHFGGRALDDSLIIAVCKRHVAILRLLLESGIIFGERALDDSLKIATKMGEEKIVDLLFKHNKPFGKKALDDSLAAAVLGDHLGTTNLLLKSGNVFSERALEKAFEIAVMGSKNQISLLLAPRVFGPSDHICDILNSGEAAYFYSEIFGIPGFMPIPRSSLGAVGKRCDLEQACGLALVEAAWRGCGVAVSRIIGMGMHKHLLTEALTAAAGRGHEIIVKLLLESRRVYYEGALLAAVKGDHVGTLNLLLDSIRSTGVSVDRITCAKVLERAALGGHGTIVEKLLELDGCDTGSGRALMATVRGGKIRTFRLIFFRSLGHIDFVSSENSYGKIFVAAVERGNMEIMDLLLEHVTIPIDSYGEALIAAAERGQVASVRFIIDHNPTDCRKCYRRTPVTAARHGYDEIVRLIPVLDEDNEAACNEALSAAASRGYWEVVRLLLEVNVGDMDSYGVALIAAARGGQEGIVNRLLESGGIKDGDCYCPALVAAGHSHEEIVNLLRILGGI